MRKIKLYYPLNFAQTYVTDTATNGLLNNLAEECTNICYVWMHKVRYTAFWENL